MVEQKDLPKDLKKDLKKDITATRSKSKTYKIIKISAAALCAAAVVAMVIITGMRNADNVEKTLNTTVMGTTASLTVYGREGDSVINGIMDIENNLDKKVISWRSEGSEVWNINHLYSPGENYPISSELADIMDRTLAISKDSGDLLDITIRPLAELWGIESGKTDIPSQADIDDALTHVDVTQVSCINNEKGAFVNIAKSGMSLDFGAVGKGYGCDLAADYLEENAVTGACIALGGSIMVYGNKPDGSAWKIGVKNPRSGEGSVMGVINEDGGATTFVSTSGDYEKYFEKDGKRYHHILDPKTGYPAWQHIISATVVCDNGLMSDALSTLCMLAGKEQSMELVSRYGADVILIDDQKNVYVSDGLKGKFTITEEEYKLAE